VSAYTAILWALVLAGAVGGVVASVWLLTWWSLQAVRGIGHSFPPPRRETRR
jgi:hypothetical protein